MTTTSTGATDAHPSAFATDRRAFLAAAPALAALTAGPATTAPSTTSGTAWDIAMRRLIDATAAYRHYADTVHDPACRSEKAFFEAHEIKLAAPSSQEKYAAIIEQFGSAHLVPDEVSEEQDRLCEVMCGAEDALMQMPAPHDEALRWKLDRIMQPGDTPESMPCWALSYVRQTIADYRRLLGDA